MNKYNITLSNKKNNNFSFIIEVQAVNEYDAIDVAYAELFDMYGKTDETYELKLLEKL